MKISVKIKNRINAYTHDWPQKLKNERIIDGESYSVIIESEKEIKKYLGEGSFPTNYNEFKRYIFNIKEKKAIITADCTQ